MQPFPTTVILKYFEPLDQFIRVRVFAREQALQLLRRHRPKDKQAYVDLVVRNCIEDFTRGVLPRIRLRFDRALHADVQASLYGLCVEVNPGLDIHQVSIPLAEPAAGPSAGSLLASERSAPRLQVSRSRLRALPRRMKQRIIGQDQVVERLGRAVQKAALGLRDERRPLGCFLFVGSTGVGKTELAKALADGLFADPSRLIRVDCSELAMPHEYARLVGSPPGYVGHADGGMLTEAIKANPQSVVLFDEIEKADGKVHNLLLQVMDDGVLTDGRGELVSLRQAVIILTSNVGADEMKAIENRAGFRARGETRIEHSVRDAATRRALEQHFRPEFMNRLDEVLVFRDLGEADGVKIAGLFLKDLCRRAKRLGCELRVTAGAQRCIAQRGFSIRYGAREIGRAVQRLVEDPITEKILSGQLPAGARLRVGTRRGELRIEAAA